MYYIVIKFSKRVCQIWSYSIKPSCILWNLCNE